MLIGFLMNLRTPDGSCLIVLETRANILNGSETVSSVLGVEELLVGPV